MPTDRRAATADIASQTAASSLDDGGQGRQAATAFTS